MRLLRPLPNALSRIYLLPMFFGIKVGAGLLIIKLSAQTLSGGDFAAFSQLFLLSGLANTIAAGGTQNGLIRQVAVSGNNSAIITSIRAAQIIWMSVSLLSAILSLFGKQISNILIGEQALGWAVPCVFAISAISGLGLIYNAVLTGLGRIRVSLISQALGVLIGTGLAALALLRGQAVLAVLGFAAGSLFTSAASWWAVRRSNINGIVAKPYLAAEIRRLLGYSGAFVAVAIMMPLTLFTLRYFYREQFGVDELSYWLVANRVSDVTSQLLGLYMVQFYLPMFASAPDRRGREQIIWASFLIATLVMGALFVIFALSADALVPFFLSRTFTPAIPYILIYMGGDVLRVSGSMGLHAALAQNRLWRYVGIEAVTNCLFAAFTGGLMATGSAYAPAIGYALTFASLGVGSWIWLLRGRSLDTPPAAEAAI